MRKSTFALWSGVAAILLAFAIACGTTTTTETAPVQAKASYAEDRTLIEDLQARYMFALDFKDVDKYLATFTEDGVLDIGTGEIKGHEAIRKIISGMPSSQAAKEDPKLRPATGRHNITNIVLKIDGDKASGVAYWFHYGNNNPKRTATFDSYGHYVDELAKVNGKWLFTKRRIYNEQVADWVAPAGNPSW
jgi:3-phenylpropionate/cinnamic acid dioxygenase small subunit